MAADAPGVRAKVNTDQTRISTAFGTDTARTGGALVPNAYLFMPSQQQAATDEVALPFTSFAVAVAVSVAVLSFQSAGIRVPRPLLWLAILRSSAAICG